MEEKRLYDITEVCKILGTTSRTLRFYEERGIITSTLVGLSSRRHYTEKQLLHIRNVLVLRNLGLSIKVIAELQTENVNLKDAVLSKRAEIYSFINSRLKDVDLLNEALCILESGEDIFDEKRKFYLAETSKEVEIAKICTDAFLNNNDETLYMYLSSHLVEYMPKEVYNVVKKDILHSVGDFVAVEDIIVDEKEHNKIYSKVKYSKIGLMITFVFYNTEIEGFWLGYYDVDR